MAGRKITQLLTLKTPAATDKLVIVYVSDTSESPQGTSKQIAVSNLGLSSIESSTLDVSIADGVATVDLPYTRSVFFFSVEEGSATLLSQINFLGGTISLTNTSAFVFTLTRTGGSALTGIALGGLYGTCQDAINGDPVIGVLGSGTLGIDETITFKKFDNTAISSDGVIQCGIYIDYYPNGFDA